MKQHIKQWIKKKLIDRQQRKYYRMLDEKTVSYDSWIRKREESAACEREERGTFGLEVKTVPYEACEAYVTGKAIRTEKADVVLFADADGEVSSFAEKRISDYFADNGDIDMAYGDEDVLSPEGIRYTPWLKPDWSPDTFLSSFYFGSVFAVRTEALRKLSKEEKEWIWQCGRSDERTGIYRMCYMIAQKSGGFLRRQTERVDAFCFPVGHVDEILFHARSNREMKLAGDAVLKLSGCQEPAAEDSGSFVLGSADRKPAVSVIIPSKDHAEILKRCIRSVQRAAYRPEAAGKAGGVTQEPDLDLKAGSEPEYEIIVVDNGSTEETRKELESWLKEQGALYIYRKMPFHFSQMCNMGAEAASGNVLLFLNDDVEVPECGTGKKDDISENDFLGALYQMASRSYTGAVGVKLYYPDSVRIQHAGIVNLRLGPVHKLQFKEDDVSYNYGWNRKKRNVIAVTGACLAVEKEKFVEAGGFPEELPVAFNDVDLCFSLFEKGYYNVVWQDRFLYHHESLSRGNDDSKEKMNRLLKEKDKLYERHPALYGKDPFYHKYFAGDILSTGFVLRADYDGESVLSHGDAAEDKEMLSEAREDACVMISLEYAGAADAFWKESGESREYLIQGYSFVTGSDNSCYEKRILLKSEGTETLLYIKPEILRRPDVEENLPDQIHVGLTGFRAVINGQSLPAGTYRIGVFVKDRCSGQKIYSWTNRYLDVERYGY